MDSEPTEEKLVKRLLLLIDLNGVLLHRSEDRIDVVKEDLYIRNRYYYFRPGTSELLKVLSKHYCIALYSSVARYNMVVVQNVLETGGFKFDHILDRSYNKKDEEGVEVFDTIRDFHKVWKETGYDCTNTIMLDNDARKLREYPQIGIILPEFNEDCVRKRNVQLFLDLEDYLLTIAGTFNIIQDVSRWMETHPFNCFASTYEIVNERKENHLIEDKSIVDFADFGTSMIIEKVVGGVIFYRERNVKSTIQARVYISRTKPGIIFPKNCQLARLLEICGENVIIQRREGGESIDLGKHCAVNYSQLFAFLRE